MDRTWDEIAREHLLTPRPQCLLGRQLGMEAVQQLRRRHLPGEIGEIRYRSRARWWSPSRSATMRIFEAIRTEGPLILRRNGAHVLLANSRVSLSVAMSLDVRPPVALLALQDQQPVIADEGGC